MLNDENSKLLVANHEATKRKHSDRDFGHSAAKSSRRSQSPKFGSDGYSSTRRTAVLQGVVDELFETKVIDYDLSRILSKFLSPALLRGTIENAKWYLERCVAVIVKAIA